MLQNSPLNPEVREQMKYGIDQYQRGEQAIDANRRMGPMGNVLVQTTPAGASMVAPASISDPTMATRYLDKLGAGPKTGGGSGPPPPVNDPSQQPAANQGFESTEYPSTNQQKTPPTAEELGKPPLTSVTKDLSTQIAQGTAGSGLSASTDNDFAIRQMIQERQAAGLSGAAQEGTPAGMTYVNPATGNVEPLQTSLPAARPASPTTPSPSMFSGPTAAPAPAAPALRQRAQQAQADAAQSGSFLNPATGSYEPLQHQPPALAAETAQAAQRGYFLNPVSGAYEQPAPQGDQSSQGQAAPQPQTNQPGNMLLQGSQPPNPNPGSAISQVTQQPGVALANWQNQNVHPVVAPKAVLDAVRTNVTTQAQDATYLPNGGVNGEPAWAIHMKGGGQSTISASQLAQSPWGRSLMASHNASEVMEAQSGQQPGGQQPGQGAPQTNQPGNMLLQSPGQQPSPGVQPGPQPGPPPAPGGQVWNPQQPSPLQPPAAPGGRGITDVSGNPLSAYTNVPSKGGPSPAALSAGTTGTGDLAPVPAPKDVSQSDQDTISRQAKTMGESAASEYTGDRVIQNTPGPYNYYLDDDPASPWRGRAYTALPGPAGGYFNQKRWYLGTSSYEPYELADSVMRQHMADYWIPTGELTRPEISKMKEEQMKPWLQRAWYNDHMAKSPVDAGTNLTLDAGVKLHNSLKTIHDMVQTLGENGYPNLNVDDRIRAAAENASVSLTSKRPAERQGIIEGAGTTIGKMLGGAGDMDENTAAAIRALDQERDKAQHLIAQNPGLLMYTGKGGGQETPNIHGAAINVSWPDIPATDVIDGVFSGQDMKTRLANLDALRQSGDDRYGSLIKGAQTQFQMVDPKHAANIIRMDKGEDLPDPSNQYKDHTFPGSMSPADAIAKASASSSRQFPTEKAEDLDQFKQNNPGAYFYDEQGNLLRVRPRQK
jgi:hypothetical protein